MRTSTSVPPLAVPIHSSLAQTKCAIERREEEEEEKQRGRKRVIAECLKRRRTGKRRCVDINAGPDRIPLSGKL